MMLKILRHLYFLSTLSHMYDVHVLPFCFLDDLKIDLTPEDFLPPIGHRQYYVYQGSLTSPPCTENVFFYVMKCPIKLKREVSIRKHDFLIYLVLQYIGTCWNVTRTRQTSVVRNNNKHGHLVPRFIRCQNYMRFPLVL